MLEWKIRMGYQRTVLSLLLFAVGLLINGTETKIAQKSAKANE